MAYWFLKALVQRTAFDKVLRHWTFNVAKNLEYEGYQIGLASIFCTFFDKNLSGSGAAIISNKFSIMNESMLNQELAE